MANPHVRENRAKGLHAPPARPDVANVVILPPRDRKGVTMAGLTVGQKRFGQTPPTPPKKVAKKAPAKMLPPKFTGALATGGGLPIMQGAPKYVPGPTPKYTPARTAPVLPPPVQTGKKLS